MKSAEAVAAILKSLEDESVIRAVRRDPASVLRELSLPPDVARAVTANDAALLRALSSEGDELLSAGLQSGAPLCTVGPQCSAQGCSTTEYECTSVYACTLPGTPPNC